jgi:hypothetical protein
MSKFTAVVRPLGLAQEWVLQELDGGDMEESAREIYDFMRFTGVNAYKVTHYAESSSATKLIAIGDINLN